MLNEIQATVLRPRPAPYFGTHVLLRVDDARAGKAFLRRLIPHVRSPVDWRAGGRPHRPLRVHESGEPRAHRGRHIATEIQMAVATPVNALLTQEMPMTMRTTMPIA